MVARERERGLCAKGKKEYRQEEGGEIGEGRGARGTECVCVREREVASGPS